LKSLFAVSENYPDLKANQNFLSLQTELAETENKIEASRTEYNQDVMKYNVAVESFPGNIIAEQYGFVKKEYFELTDEHQKEVETAPVVRF
jgi:LemA protein